MECRLVDKYIKDLGMIKKKHVCSILVTTTCM